MAGVPMLNPALRVQAVGFRHWQSHWLGVLVTPWFMNLMLLPRIDCGLVAAGRTRQAHLRLPGRTLRVHRCARPGAR